MKKNIKHNANVLFEIDFSEVRRQNEIWLEERGKKGNIYVAFDEYIEFLNHLLENESDEFKRYTLEDKIKKLKKERDKYYCPSILSAYAYQRPNNDNIEEINSKSFVKTIKKIVRKK